MPRALPWIALLALITSAIYRPVFHYGFINYDDGDYVCNNPSVHAGFTAPSIHFAFTTFLMGNWNPLLWISFFADRLLLNLSPGAMHVENVLWHFLSGLLLWRLIYLMTRRWHAALVVAALFLVHPMHVESVAWITERKDVLSTPLLLAAMIAYTRYCREPLRSRRWFFYSAMMVTFILSLMVKTMGITLPAVLLLVDYWPLQRLTQSNWRERVTEKIPLLVVSAAMAVLGPIAQHAVGATATAASLGLWDRIANALVCYCIYLSKLFVPIDLILVYPHPGSRPLAAVVAATGLLVLISWICFKSRQRRPYLLMGWLWFLGTLVPVIGLVQLGKAAMADRYSYLPSVGIFVAVVWWSSTVLPRWLSTAVAVLAVSALAVLAHQQVLYWENTTTIFAHSAAVFDHNPVAHIELANEAYTRGELRKSVNECNLALRDGPDAEAYTGLGFCWLHDDLPQAIEDFRQAVALKPKSALFHVHLAMALRLHGDLPEARQQAIESLRLEPGNGPALSELKQIESFGR